MDWLDKFGHLSGKYQGNSEHPDAENDFDNVAGTVPHGTLAGAISGAMRADGTPPFAQLATTLFAHAAPEHKAGILNMIVGALGPALASQIAGRAGSASLAEYLGTGREARPDDARAVDPQVIAHLAGAAEQKDPGIVDRVAGLAAQHPELVKRLGGGFLGSALSRLAA